MCEQSERVIYSNSRLISKLYQKHHRKMLICKHKGIFLQKRMLNLHNLQHLKFRCCPYLEQILYVPKLNWTRCIIFYSVHNINLNSIPITVIAALNGKWFLHVLLISAICGSPILRVQTQFYRFIGSQPLTYEELLTVLVQLSAKVN